MSRAGCKICHWLLIPASWLYGSIILLRNALYDLGVFKSAAFDLPIISVGNITVGGTGKTPHVEYLAELLSTEYRIAVLSRGYLRRTRGFRLAGSSSTVEEVGDESMQVRERFRESPDKIVVAVDRKRANGITRLKNMDPKVDTILLDDAFQHRAVRPGLSILLIDHSRPLYGDHMLPAGTLREPAGNLARADILLVTKTPEGNEPALLKECEVRLKPRSGQTLFLTTMRYGDLFPVFREVEKRSMEYYLGRNAHILLVAGIANPKHLRQHVRGLNEDARELLFPDHHRYTRKDADRITSVFRQMVASGREVLVLTTEKDAVKLRQLEFDRDLCFAMHAVRIHVKFLLEGKETFDNQIKNYVRKNQRGSVSHQGAN